MSSSAAAVDKIRNPVVNTSTDTAQTATSNTDEYFFSMDIYITTTRSTVFSKTQGLEHSGTARVSSLSTSNKTLTTVPSGKLTSTTDKSLGST